MGKKNPGDMNTYPGDRVTDSDVRFTYPSDTYTNPGYGFSGLCDGNQTMVMGI